MAKLPELREDLHGVIPDVRALPALSLYQIEHEKADLIALREECENATECAAVDNEIREYVEREVRKVTGIAGLLRYFKGQREAARAEEERVQKQRKRWERRYDLLLAMVLQVMQGFKVQLLESATARFRIQKNPLALEITDVKAIEEKYLMASISMPFRNWKELVRVLPAKYAALLDGSIVTSNVDAKALKEACSVMMKCEDCDDGKTRITAHAPAYPCTTCNGSMLVPATVPGARLTQSEHLRVE